MIYKTESSSGRETFLEVELLAPTPTYVGPVCVAVETYTQDCTDYSCVYLDKAKTIELRDQLDAMIKAWP